MSRRTLGGATRNLYNEPELSSHTHVDTVKTPEGSATHMTEDVTINHGNGCAPKCNPCKPTCDSGYGGYSIAWIVVIFFIIFFIVWIFLHLFNHDKLRKYDCEEPDLGKTLVCAFIVTLILLFIIWIIWAVAGGR